MERYPIWLTGLLLAFAVQAHAGSGRAAASEVTPPTPPEPPAVAMSQPGDDAIRAKGSIAGGLLQCGAASATEVEAWVQRWRDMEADAARFEALYREGFEMYNSEYVAATEQVRQGACKDAHQLAGRMRGPDGPDLPYGNEAAHAMGATSQMLLLCAQMTQDELEQWKQATKSLATDPERYEVQYNRGAVELLGQYRDANASTRKAICEEAASLAGRLRARAEWMFD